MVASSSNRDLISDLLVELRDGLAPVIERVLGPVVPPNRLWTALLEERDRIGGRPVGRYARTDLQSMLSAMTGRLGTLGYPFSPVLGSRANQLLPEELRKVRNDWAHMAEFSNDETDRAFASGSRLLRAVGALEQADRVELTLDELRRARYGSGSAPVAARGGVIPSEPPPDGSTLTPADQSPDVADHSSRPSDAAPEARAVAIEVDALDVLSYAMAHNRVVPVSRIDLTSSVVARGAAVTVALLQDSGPIGEPQSYVVDLVPGETTSVPLERFPLDGAAMLAIESERPGFFEFEVRHNGEVLGRVRQHVDLLAAQQWTGRPLELGLEMLAAHVTPHHPEVQVLMSEAAEVLRERTGDPSLNAYQQDDDRTDEIAQAFAVAVQNRSIRYANPPGTWTGSGQIVRTATEVLNERFGTCLDTTVVLAAALEEAGIHPILVVVQGHAFVGYFRGNDTFGVPVATEVNEVANAIDLDLIGLIETTRLTDPDPIDFLAMRRTLIARHFRGDGASEFLGAVDVAAARHLPVLALPVRGVQPDGTEVIVEYRATPAPLPEREAVDGRHVATSLRREPPRVTAWKSALLDLSLRNRLLNFTDSARLPLILPEDAAAEVENQLNAGRTISLVPNDRIPQIEVQRGVRTAADLSADKLITKLRSDRSVHVALSSERFLTQMRRLANSARVIAEETGANNLYLAVGSLLWSVKGKAIRSPLILIPVSLKARARGESYQLTIDESGASTPNFCLIEKLRQEARISIPALEEPQEDESGIDIDATLHNVRQALMTEGLPFQVEASLDLGILQFAKFRLWKDMDEHWSTFASNPLVDHLLSTPNLPFQERTTEDGIDLDELAALTPVSADASQLAAVSDALAGRTFVLEGPPGTGKSQTITNLLARAIADGKRVLFVAEKRAALEVVQRRLTAVGLAPFALDLHDKASRLNELRRQLREALDANTGFDKDRLDAANANLRRTANSLRRYAQRVHAPNPLGLSLYGARLRELSFASGSRPIELTTADVESLSVGDINALIRTLEAAPETTHPARPRRGHGWEFVTDDVAQRLRSDQLQAASDQLDAAIGRLEGTPAQEVVTHLANTSELRAAASALRIDRGLQLDAVERAGATRWREAADDAIMRARAFASTDHPVLRTLDHGGLDLDLEQLRIDAQTAADSGFFGRKKRQRAVLSQFGSHLKVDGNAIRKTLPTFIDAAITLRSERDAVRDQVARIPELSATPQDPFDPAWADALRSRQQILQGAADRLAKLAPGSALHPFVRAALARDEDQDRRELADRLEGLADAVDALEDEIATSGGDLGAWRAGRGWVAAWSAGVSDRHGAGGSTLRRWYEHLEGLRAVKQLARTAGLQRLYAELVDGSYPVDEAAEAFELAIAHASVAERQAAEQLTDFDARLHDQIVDRYRTALDDVQRILPAALPHDLVSKRRFDAASSTGSVGLLRRQLDRQRGGMTIRALLNEFSDLILTMTPCVLVSPESVARFFPARADLFDLVVFDEASQVRVADAIGAMGRGKSVVVVGDSKQMPPSAFAIAGGSVDDESGLTASGDEESILSECVKAQVTSRRLTWHYRSRQEALIAFSNEHYYDSKLTSFPSPRTGPDQAPVIDFVPVAGEFLRSGKGKDKRTNPAEAYAIVQDIEQRFDSSPDSLPSVGVVTFNKEQRDLIESLLRDSSDSRIGEALDLPAEGLFVKNLENVQGDERDAILFSVAFSRNERGDLPLNFGPLTQAGGERRLNVAITRAREQVLLFCSFDPAELRAEQTQSVGIKHLRDYLRLAQQGQPDALAMRRKSRADGHRDDIADALRERGMEVTTDIGLSDFRVDLAIASTKDREIDALAVLLDTPDWHGRRTVHDRDVLPSAVLQHQMGWASVSRVWLPDWLENRHAVVERLCAAAVEASQLLEEKQQAGAASAADGLVLDLPERAGDDAGATGSVIAWQVPPRGASAPAGIRHRPDFETRFARFVPWTYRGSGRTDVLDQLPRPSAARVVGSAVGDIVQQEGPIRHGRLVRLAAAEFGLSRVSPDRANAILRTLDSTYVRTEDSDFAWPAGMNPRTWSEYRWSTQADERDVRRISPVEIANAMRHIAEETAGIGREALIREALNRFGSRRVTADVQAHLDSALQAGIDLDKLVVGGNGTIRPLSPAAAGAAAPSSSARAPGDDRRWDDLLVHATDLERALLVTLQQLGVPAPELGGEAGEGIPVAISWPDRKVAVSHGLTAADGAELAGLGWRVVRPDAPSIVALLSTPNER